MTNIQTINGISCCMVSPIQLTKESIFPCAVRLINDGSQRGKYNRWENRHYLKDIEIIDGLREEPNGRVSGYMPSTAGRLAGINIEVVEIIGYPMPIEKQGEK